MGTGSFKKNGISLYFIYQKPIRFNVTLSPVLKISFQFMVLVFFFQRLSIDEFFDNFPYLRYVFARFYRLDQIFVKFIGSFKL